jgi:hypothetical protein
VKHTASPDSPWPARDRLLRYLQEHAGQSIPKKQAMRESQVTRSEFQNVLMALSADPLLAEDNRGRLLYLMGGLANAQSIVT